MASNAFLDINGLSRFLTDLPQKFLALTGGTVTGQTTFGSMVLDTSQITKTTDDSGLYLYGGSGYLHGAQMSLYGTSHSSCGGWVRLKASDGSNSVDLLAKPTGSLTWNGNEVLTAADKRGFFAPSSTYTDLTLGSSGTTYTAPADGWVCFGKTSSGTNQYGSMRNTTTNMNVASNLPSSGQSLYLLLPVGKGDVFNVTYNFGGTTKIFRFFYAVGAV